MIRSAPRFQILGVVVAAALALGAGLKVFNPTDPSRQSQRSGHQFSFSLLTQDIAAPGKTVFAVRNGKQIASYKCTGQDAAVVWMFDETSSTPLVENQLLTGFEKHPRMFEMARALDEQGREFPLIYTQNGPVICLRVPRGYATKPQHLTFYVPEGLASVRTRPSRKKITVEALAEPIKAIESRSKPIADSSVPFEAICETNKAGQSSITLRPAFGEPHLVLSKDEFYDHRILGSTYFPPGELAPQLAYFGDQNDVIRVRIDRYRNTWSRTKLIYQNAQVVSVNGLRTLKFPTTQDVGEVMDAKAIVNKYVPAHAKSAERLASIGDFVIRLQRKRHPEVRFSPQATLLSIQPSPAELGLDLLRVRLGGGAIGMDVRSETKSASGPNRIVPKIVVEVEVRNPVLVSTQTLDIPLKHISSKPHHQTFAMKGSDRIQSSLSVYLPTEETAD